GSPECEPQQSAISSRVNPKRSTAPSRTRGAAWKGFAPDRKKVTRSGLPTDARKRPLESTTAVWTRCRDSRIEPRITSTLSSIASPPESERDARQDHRAADQRGRG